MVVLVTLVLAMFVGATSAATLEENIVAGVRADSIAIAAIAMVKVAVIKLCVFRGRY